MFKERKKYFWSKFIKKIHSKFIEDSISLETQIDMDYMQYCQAHISGPRPQEPGQRTRWGAVRIRKKRCVLK